MNELNFVQVQKDDPQHCALFTGMMLPYNRELDYEYPGDEVVRKVARGMIEMLGPHDRHHELAFVGEEPVGFFYGKVDHAEHRGFVKPGFGYVMEFYVRPEYRRKGYATQMLRRLEQHFASHGVTRMWLNADPASEAFWRATGFAPTDEISPDNGMVVYEKPVATPPAACP